MASNEDIFRAIGTLEGTVKTYIEDARTKQATTDKRLASVEKKQYWLSGAVGTAVFVIQHFGQKLMGGGSQI